MIATTPEQRTDELRRKGVRLAVAFLVTYGDRDTALNILLTSLVNQARINGVRLPEGLARP